MGVTTLGATHVCEGSSGIVACTVGEITVGHRTFSEHFRHLSDQKPIRSANLSERTTSDERARTGNAQHAPAPVR